MQKTTVSCAGDGHSGAPGAAEAVHRAEAFGFLPLEMDCPGAESSAGPASTADLAEVYELLYERGGYHDFEEGEKGASKRKAAMAALPGVETVLDVGCSVGIVVEKLWNLGYTACGADISQTAVALAESRTARTRRRCVGGLGGTGPSAGCFRQGDVSKLRGLPWGDRTFDAVISTARHDPAEDFSRLNALLFTASWIFIPAYTGMLCHARTSWSTSRRGTFRARWRSSAGFRQNSWW